MKNLLILLTLFLFSCHNPVQYTGVTVKPSYGNWVTSKTVCNGVEREGEPKTLIISVTSFFAMTTKISNTCDLVQSGTVGWDQVTFSLTQTNAYYSPANCDLNPLPINHTLTGPGSIDYSPMKLTWTYVNYRSENCVSTFYR